MFSGCVRASRCSSVAFGTRGAAELARRDEHEQPARAEQPQGLVDVAGGDRPVRAEGDRDHVRELARRLQPEEERERLGELPAAMRVGVVAAGGESRKREQHRRVADRQRRDLTGGVAPPVGR
jgi:hypothetical protein